MKNKVVSAVVAFTLVMSSALPAFADSNEVQPMSASLRNRVSAMIQTAFKKPTSTPVKKPRPKGGGEEEKYDWGQGGRSRGLMDPRAQGSLEAPGLGGWGGVGGQMRQAVAGYMASLSGAEKQNLVGKKVALTVAGVGTAILMITGLGEAAVVAGVAGGAVLVLMKGSQSTVVNLEN